MRLFVSLASFETLGILGGVNIYTRDLLESFCQCSPAEIELSVVGRRDRIGTFNNFTVNHIPTSLFVPTDSTGGSLRRTADRMFAFTVLTRLALTRPYDVFHFPATTIPSRWRSLPGPFVLTFHDLQHEFLPENFSGQDLQWRKKEYLASVQRANLIIAVSQHTAETLQERYNVKKEKVRIIPEGVNETFLQPIDQNLAQRVCDSYELTRPFIFYPANTWPHKNHIRLLHALNILREQHKLDCQLVLTGRQQKAQNKIMQTVQDLRLNNQVKWLAYIPRSHLPAIYFTARMLVFPSLFEGFGIPLLEAMACGCPIACSNRGSLPELAGEAAILFDPTKPEAIAESIYRLWTDDILASQLSQKGKERAMQYQWKYIAEQTIQVYREVTN